MLGYLKGTVAHIYADRVLLDVNGLGFEVFVSAGTARALTAGSPATLVTHMSFAQDAVTLFGFLTQDEREIFRRLISVSRVGPKAAMAVLSSMSASEAAMCIVTGNERALSRVPGLGKKTAQRIILELKEKLSTESAFDGASALPAGDAAPLTDAASEALAALVALGYDTGTATKAVNEVKGEAATVEELLKSALKALGRKR